MTLFNYARYVAGEITSNKNCDKKIIISGPAGAGKSMTAVKLAQAIAKWIPYWLIKRYGIVSKPEDFFKFDDDHIAIIDGDDLRRLMVNPLVKHSIKIADDCGTADGVTSRRSMSKANLNTISIYGTNRTNNGVLIIAVQDTTFIDKRLRMLANEVIDLANWYQVGPIRIGQLRKIRITNTAKYGIGLRKFRTYEHGRWVSQESIACMMPDDDIKMLYDEKRKEKQEAQTALILKELENKDKKEIQDSNKKICPSCGCGNKTKIHTGKKYTRCYSCGHKWV